MPFSIFEKKICYATFETQDQNDEPLLRCSQCQCAYYKSKEHQKSHWKIHKFVCKRPDFEKIKKMSGSKCLEILTGDRYNRVFDHNTAAIFERLFDLIREAFDCGENELDGKCLTTYGLQLHSIARRCVPHAVDDVLERYYQFGWACPGMPQLLYFTDLRNASQRTLMKHCPDGYPCLAKKSEKVLFDNIYKLTGDQSGEEVAWFVVEFLVRSRVWGDLTMDSRHDGQGHLRDTTYAQAATKRIGQIFSSRCLRKSINDVCFPFIGFFLNMAEKRLDEFYKLLEAGVAPGLIEWATVDYSKQALKLMESMNLCSLSDDRKVDILEICCSIFDKTEPLPWSSDQDIDDEFFYRDSAHRGEELSNKITKICLNIACNILNGQPNILTLLERGISRRLEKEDSTKYDMIDFGKRRMALAYLQDKFLFETYNPTPKDVREWIKAWGKVDVWDKVKFAKKVMEDKNLHNFVKHAAMRKRKSSKKEK